MTFVNKCIKDNLVRLLVCFCLSTALVMSILSKSTFNKEPVTQNPFKLVYEVIKYAIKNKQPRCRSAFTYCEDDIPSHIDFGKSKYGGSFTTEQVEDVKTLLSFNCLCCTLPGTITAVNLLTGHLSYLTNDSKIADTKAISCHFNKFYVVVTSLTLITALLIPLYEFAVYPIVRRHFSWVKSHLKVLFGVLLLTSRVVALMVFC